MTVKELIKKLQTFPENHKVYLYGSSCVHLSDSLIQDKNIIPGSYDPVEQAVYYETNKEFDSVLIGGA